MFCPLPVIHFKPTVDYSPEAALYECPLYLTTARAGALSTTGLSTNFVACMPLPVERGTLPDAWTLQGVAAMCSLAD